MNKTSDTLTRFSVKPVGEVKNVKMGSNLWTNGFEPDWSEKNYVFSNVGQIKPDSLDPQVEVKQVRTKLSVGWHVTHQQQSFIILYHFFFVNFFIIIIYYS